MVVMCADRSRHGGHFDSSQQDAGGRHMAQSSSQTLNMGASHSRVQQSGGKRSKARHAESRAR